MTTSFGNVRVILAVFGAAFGLLAVGCEKDVIDHTQGAAISATNSVAAVPASPSTTSAANPAPAVPEPTNTASAVLNDDPNCQIELKYQGRTIPNTGQVHYVNRVLTSDPFGSANPICVQYDDCQLGEVTVWKDPSSTGRHVDVLPSNRCIDKIVVWYN